MDLRTLSAPVIAAPMAGGPSTPELVAAVSAAGGYGYLAGGYRTPDALREQIAAARALTAAPFGVNVFVLPALDEAAQVEAVRAYAQRLAPLATDLGVRLPDPRWDDTDWFAEKIDLLVEEAVDSVSFTFGLPGREVVDRLHAVGTSVAVTVTDVAEARAAEQEGADVLCVQSADAGGHRSTHQVEATPNDLSTADLLPDVRSATGLPLIAAGGVSSATAVRQALDLGAVAVQVGTAFLLTDEAGTSAAHRAGLRDATLTEPVVTRAFSGRPARGLRNAFIDDLDAYAPPVFPIVDQLTKPLRAAAAKATDHQRVSLWAGAGWRDAQLGNAARVVADLTP